MLPYYTNATKSNKTIYINPNFRGQLLTPEATSLEMTNVIPKNSHINPLFLDHGQCRNTIHMNPAFIQKIQEQQRNDFERIVPQNMSSNVTHLEGSAVDLNKLGIKNISSETRKIICNSKNRLIREPLMKNNNAGNTLITKPSSPLQPLLVVSKRKLIRKIPIVSDTFHNADANTFNDCQTRPTKYKLDNRLVTIKPILPPIRKLRRTCFVKQYGLKRTSFSEVSNIAKPKRDLSINKNMKLQVLNINGLLYKSTRNSLKLKGIPTAHTSIKKRPSNTNEGLTIFVRGNKYIMDANKFKLTRVANSDTGSSNQMQSNNSFKNLICKRIDIGGYTYISTNSSKNVFIRTKNHLSRAYVHIAKQKSLQTLTKNLVKTNIPCPIFQHIGKCAAFERGKCSKVHNKLQVAICTKFLRGECPNSNCLLSHNISLSKMPVCKFFLQGLCVRNDCHYLHKKLSSSAKLCTDFLRGFCEMADKCKNRHEFLCPEIERHNICNVKNCIYCNAKKRKELQIKSMKYKCNETTASHDLYSRSIEISESQACKRYFIDSSDVTLENANEEIQHHMNKDTSNVTDVSESSVRNNVKSRPKLGALPSYIPL